MNASYKWDMIDICDFLGFYLLGINATKEEQIPIGMVEMETNSSTSRQTSTLTEDQNFLKKVKLKPSGPRLLLTSQGQTTSLISSKEKGALKTELSSWERLLKEIPSNSALFRFWEAYKDWKWDFTSILTLSTPSTQLYPDKRAKILFFLLR